MHQLCRGAGQEQATAGPSTHHNCLCVPADLAPLTDPDGPIRCLLMVIPCAGADHALAVAGGCLGKHGAVAAVVGPVDVSLTASSRAAAMQTSQKPRRRTVDT